MTPNEKRIANRRTRIEREVRAAADPDDAEADIQGAIDDAIADEEHLEHEDRAQHLEINGEPEDSPCVESCDRWGTGEGRYHGVM